MYYPRRDKARYATAVTSLLHMSQKKALSPAFAGPLWPRGHCVYIATSKSKDSELCPRSIIVYAVWFLNEH
jgi:hypothetical protein